MRFELNDGNEMLRKQYLKTARSILRAAQEMTDQHVAGQLKALAEGYQRRGTKAVRADAAKKSESAAPPAECKFETDSYLEPPDVQPEDRCSLNGSP